MSSSFDDCYFYYYSTCNRGDECPYRHCEAALGTETVCSLWKEGMCMRINCKYRHMESRINRSTIPCYWESQPTGCLKPHCVFLHTKGRGINIKSSDNKNSLHPTSAQAQTIPPVVKSIAEDNPNEISLSPSFSEPIKTTHLGTPAVPVEPVVVSLNDNEESDSESLSNTPIKVPPESKAKSGYQKNLFKDADDFGIKTLEQLRMEKILKESEHFYKSPYDAPALVTMPKSTKAENQTIFSQRNLGNHAHDTTETSSEDDLRDILKRRKGRQSEEKQLDAEEPRKRVISLKRSACEITENHPNITITVNKNKKNEVCDDSPSPKTMIMMEEKTEAESDITSKVASISKEKKVKDDLRFKIKTLEEIRKEKSEKGLIEVEKSETSLTVAKKLEKNWTEAPKSKIIKLSRRTSPKKETMISVPSKISSIEEPTNNVGQTSNVSRPRVKRPAREIYQVKAVVMSNGLSPTKQKHSESPLKKAKLSPDQQNGLADQESSPSKNGDDSKSSEMSTACNPSRRILRLHRPSNTSRNIHTSEDPPTKLTLEEDSSLNLPGTKNREKSINLSGLGSFIRRRSPTKTISLAREEESKPVKSSIEVSSSEEEPKSSALDIFFQINKQSLLDITANQSVPAADPSSDSTIGTDVETIPSTEKLSNKHLQDSFLEMPVETSNDDLDINKDIENDTEISKEVPSAGDRTFTKDHSISVEDVDTFLTEGDDFGDFDENENSVEQTEDIFQEIEEILKS